MSAIVIPFPRKHPLQSHELPENWPAGMRGLYTQMTYDGHSTHEDAFEYCDTMAMLRQEPGESGREYSLRRAREEIRLAFARQDREASRKD